MKRSTSRERERATAKTEKWVRKKEVVTVAIYISIHITQQVYDNNNNLHYDFIFSSQFTFTMLKSLWVGGKTSKMIAVRTKRSNEATKNNNISNKIITTCTYITMHSFQALCEKRYENGKWLVICVDVYVCIYSFSIFSRSTTIYFIRLSCVQFMNNPHSENKWESEENLGLCVRECASVFVWKRVESI